MITKFRSLTCAIALLTTLAGAIRAQSNRTNAAAVEEAKVLEVVSAFNRAFAANDSAKYFSYIDPEIVVITPSNPYRVEGIIHDREEFDYSLRKGIGRVGYFQELQRKVQMFANAAIVTYYSRGSYGREGEEKVAYYKETDVLARRGDTWKIVHIHVSATR
jgi:ketosteroid isomerase-like protein